MFFSLVLAASSAAQYPTPQAPAYAAPPPAPAYSIPITYTSPQVVTLGAGQVAPAGLLGQCLGRLGQKLERCAWPRVQPIAASAPPPAAQVVYLQVQQPVLQAAYAAPAYAPPIAAPPYAGIPQQPAKGPAPAYGTPQAQPSYGTPQAQQPQYNAPKPSESVPPVPNR